MHLENITVQQIIDALPDAVQLINQDFTVDLSNNSLKTLFAGKTGSRCYEKFGLNSPCPSCPMRKSLESNSSQSCIVESDADGRYSLFLIPVNSGTNGIIEVIRRSSTSMDKSDMELLDEQIKLYSDKIGTMTTAFFGMAHNLKNPLTAIQGKIQIFGMRHPEFKTELEILLAQCDNMSKMLGEITDKFKLEQATAVRPIDVNNLIENELRFISLDLNVKHKIQKKFTPEENLPPVLAVYSDLSNIINNIIKNSVAAVMDSERKIISITTSSDGGKVNIFIEDSGCGIPKEELPRIFMPFYSGNRKNNDTNKKSAGRGMGLFIVYQLVHKYDGNVDIESREGIGTIVKLQFPSAQPVELKDTQL